MKIKLLFILGFLAFFAFTQCKSEKKAKEKQAVESNEEASGFSDNEKIMYSLPSPDEIFSEIFMEEMNLKPEYVNPSTNASNYIDVKSQAINLGVYISDFAYLSAIESNTDELAYLKIIRELMDKVNLYGIVNEEMLDRINENLMVKDSLNKISQELYYKMSNILENSDRNNILVLVSTGAIVEALYLAINNIEFNHSGEVIQKIFDQKFVFDNYYEFASQYSDDIYVKTVLNELSVIKNMFEHLDFNDSKINVTKESGSDFLVIQGGKEIIVTEEAYLGFRENITNVRNLLVSISKSINQP
ncbi:MAG TPA: hypothetical protein DCG75_14485 [Bacteroidales bacterium]|nr:hypothetical protein [Bacteroidales bacterium]